MSLKFQFCANLRKLCLVFILIFCCDCTLSSEPPELIPYTTFNVGDLSGWIYTENKTGLIASFPSSNFKTLSLNFNCTANYPIKWKITGFINMPEKIEFKPPKRDLVRNLYVLELRMEFKKENGIVVSTSSMRIHCKSFDENSILQRSIGIFSSGSNSLVQSPQNLTVKDSFIIPCVTTDPTTPVTLYKTNSHGGEELVARDYEYDPTVGFIFRQRLQGNFLCNQSGHSDSNNVTVAALINTPKGVRSYPVENTIELHPNDTVVFNCSSDNNTPIHLAYSKKKTEYQELMEGLTNITDQSGYSFVPMGSAYSKSAEFTAFKKVDGSIKCISSTEDFRTWKLVVLTDAPNLYLDNYKGEVNCAWDYNSKEKRSISTVRCRDSNHCEFMKRCVQNVSFCNFEKQNLFFSTDTAYTVERSKRVAKVSYFHLNGLVLCSSNGLERFWEFFVALDYIRYFDWRQAPKNQLVRLDDIEPVLYANNTQTFFCAAVAYLFADSLTFELEYQNNTRKILLEGIDEYKYRSPRKIDEFNIIKEVRVNLTIDAVAIHCLAPWWNSTEYLRVERRFVTKYLLKPRIVDTPRKTETFIIGEKHRRLVCIADGVPKPTYSWFRNKTNMLEDSDYKVNIGPKGESVLEFPTIKEFLNGKYICVANNSVGEDEYEFLVHVNGEGISIYILSIAAILVVVCILALTLGILFQRYRESQKLLRSLTEKEIEEFFNGTPGGLKLAPETKDDLPYDENYEIIMDDLEFDYGNVLGSGAFAYVVKGVQKSSSQVVAVKIAKPSADVTLFKSLLTELKVLIYIGEHENVAKLVGVNTRDIRNRSIYIVMEMCELGSLDNYLRKSRETFKNLIQENQMIISEVLKEEKIEVNTIDLIQWSADIAMGMEFLAYKSIIHADLATRNVLLNYKRVAKISDFGLSRKLHQCDNYVKKTRSPLPWRWMAPESLSTMTFSTYSDIWSYGVTLWEIFTLGDIPFPSETWNKDFQNRLDTGMRMGKPKYSTPEIYLKMSICWEHKPSERADFCTLRQYFLNLYQSLRPTDASVFGKSVPKNSHTSTTQVEPTIQVGCSNPEYYLSY